MKIALAIYDNLAPADAAIAELQQLGVPPAKIGLLAGRGTAYGSYHDRDGRYRYVSADESILERPNGSATEWTNATVAGLGGTVVGFGMLAIPAVGPILAAGPLLAGIVAGGLPTTDNDIETALTDLGVPPDDASVYRGLVERGHAMVLARIEHGLVDRVAEILDRHGPVESSATPSP